MAASTRRAPPALAIESAAPSFAALHRAVHAIQQAVHESDLDVTHAEAVVLALLAQTGQATMGEIHRGFGFRKSTVTNVIDRLVDRKLAERHADPSDGRSWLVGLTPAGVATSRRVLKIFRDVELRVARILAGDDS